MGRGSLLSAGVFLTLAGCFGTASDAGAAQTAGPAQGHFVISAGPFGEEHHAWGDSLATEIARQGSGASLGVVDSSGSVSNLRRLTIGTADLAIATADTLSPTPDSCAEQVSAGAIDENRVPLRAVSRIYEDFLQVLVRGTAPIESVADLAGRPVAVGQTGSGSALMACRVLQTAGVEVESKRLGLDAGIEALNAGSVDAVFWSGGLPTRTIESANEDEPLRLLSLGPLAEQLRQEYGPGYRPAAVPDGVYGSTEQITTVASPNILVSRADADPAMVNLVLETIFSRQDEMTEQVPAAVATDRRTAILTGEMDLHPAATDYYRTTHL
ncbi:TAXI family TRAP transporter solute-binding subunit [Kineosporia babensis]